MADRAVVVCAEQVIFSAEANDFRRVMGIDLGHQVAPVSPNSGRTEAERFGDFLAGPAGSDESKDFDFTF